MEIESPRISTLGKAGSGSGIAHGLGAGSAAARTPGKATAKINGSTRQPQPTRNLAKKLTFR
ncbi:MAG: hypothetical protein SynsKO_06450 [Synoicihabitans sp.]